MDAVTLLHRAHDAGLRLKPVGDQLLVSGPKRAEPLVRLLAAHKVAVMAALAVGDDRARPAPKERDAAAEPAFWQDFFAERAAHREFDGGYSREEAERLAFGEMILEWHRRYSARPDPDRCAGCGDDLVGEISSPFAMVHASISRVLAASVASPPTERSGGVLQWRRCALSG